MGRSSSDVRSIAAREPVRDGPLDSARDSARETAREDARDMERWTGGGGLISIVDVDAPACEPDEPPAVAALEPALE